ncbi:hypothetical protein AVEN_47663-1 [Araneus ventricosus]|uniref:Uncharacterized protein n=1 Tax=Araneus ventricosus TaxID=182803 RepID=A0A4Y2VKQ7_ARAVE|nr:hypothetical protein AVEN_47663-1 [Araneus ventricosus]
MKGAGQFKVTKRGFGGQGITFALGRKVLTREINGTLHGERKWHRANEETRTASYNGRISFVGRSGELDFTYAGERQVCFESRLGSTHIRDCEFGYLRIDPVLGLIS